MTHNQRSRYRFTLAFLLAVVPSLASGSPELDALYSFRKVAGAVVNRDREPVHGGQVEQALVQFFTSRMRFEWMAEPSERARAASATLPSLGQPGQENLAAYQTVLSDMAEAGADAVVLGEVQKGETGYSLFFVLAVPSTGELIRSAQVPVINSRSLDSFVAATVQGLDQLVSGIPFDASIVSREGYRVVMDTGYPTLRTGMRVPTYTLERVDDRIHFVETGTIEVTRSERSLAFGKILVDRFPLQVGLGNKFRVRPKDLYTGNMPVGPAPRERKPASLATQLAFQKGRLGNMNVNVGASFVTHTVTAASGSDGDSQQTLYPGGSLRGELWLTGRWFLGLGFHFATAVLSTAGSGQAESLNSNMSSFSSLLGYRLNFSPEKLSPTVFFQAGYASHRFLIDAAQDPVFFRNATYSGLAAGAGADLPLSKTFGIGGAVTTMLFPSFDEGELTSGAAVSRVFGLDFHVRAYYNLTRDLDLEARFWVQSLSAQFTGAGTQPVSLASTSRSQRSLLLGLTYYF